MQRLVECFVIGVLAWLLALLVSQANAAVNPARPDAKTEATRTFRHVPKGCSDTKPREVIRLRMFKMDKDGRFVEVGVVLIPKGC